MNVVIHISPNSGTPIYLQIVQQLRYQIASGRLKPGAELPPIRLLAERLLTNPNTVGRAYRELEQEGLLVSRVGSGTRVSDRGSPLAFEERNRILGEYADSLLAVAKQLNFDIENTIEMVRARHARMQTGNAMGGPDAIVAAPNGSGIIPDLHGESKHE